MTYKNSRFHEHAGIILRGYRMIRGIDPLLLIFVIADALASAAPLIVNLYFSPKILTMMTQKAALSSLMLFVASMLLTNYLLSFLQAQLERQKNNHRDLFHYKVLLYISEHYAHIEFSYAEKGKTIENLQSILSIIRAYRGGLQRLEWTTGDILRVMSQAIGCLFLLLDMERKSVKWSASSLLASPVSSLAVLLFILLAFLFTRKILLAFDSRTNQNTSYWAKNNAKWSYYNEYIGVSSAAKDIRIYQQGDAISTLLHNQFSQSEHIHIVSHEEGSVFAKIAGIHATVLGCIYLLATARASAGVFDAGRIVRYIGAITALMGSITNIIRLFSRLWNNCGYLSVLFEFMDIPFDSQNLLQSNFLTIPKVNNFTIVFENVSFRYPGAKTDALDNVSFELPQRGCMAVVGRNGSGKSTMIKLLCRLYNPTQGRILLNGTDIQQYTYSSYRKLLSVVFQDFHLLPLSLGQNVAALSTVNPGLAEECLMRAGMDPHSKQFSNGLDTILYKDFDINGVAISGGEAQKIAIARALYKQAPLIVLDEPTAALDPIAEQEIYEHLHKVVEDDGKKVIFISHRLSSCRFCDSIAVFDEGKLVQQGTHQNLLKDQNGVYHQLWLAQAQYYTNTTCVGD